MRRLRLIVRKIFGRRIEISLVYCIPGINFFQNTFSKIPSRLFSIPCVFFLPKHTIPYVEMDVTSRCTLCCKECTHFMPLYRQNGLSVDFDTETLQDNINSFLALIDKCLMFRLLGGEPFLHKDLHLLIDNLATQKKVQHIQIVTNGTLLPQGKNLTALKHKNVSVSISNYGRLSAKKEELVALFQANGVQFRLSPYSPKWFETDSMKPRGYSEEKMHSIFFQCPSTTCKSLHDGRLWVCPQARAGVELGLVPENTLEYIDLHSSKKDEFWEKIDRMYENPKGLTACHYCKGGCVSPAKAVPCAVQVEVVPGIVKK